MTALRLLVLWWLIGAVFQIAMMLRLRLKYGSYFIEATTRIVLGRFWLLKMLSSCFFWPIAIWTWFFKKPKAEEVKAVVDHMHNRCFDCGEPLEGGLHEAEKCFFDGRPPS